MSAIKAVPESVPDSKKGKPRQKSPVAFTYYNLDQSVLVAKAIFDNAGGACGRDALAEYLKYKSKDNGSFLTRVTAAKAFGVIEQDGALLKITDRGRAIVSPVTDEAAAKARVDAFLDVELFRKFFEEYAGRPLPPDVGLRNHLETKYQVVKDRAGPTVKILLDSAEQAGFFKIAGNRTKMVMPAVGPAGTSANKPAVRPDTPVDREEVQEEKRNGGGGGGGGDDSGIHPAILGMLKDLPKSGTMSKKRRETFLTAFGGMIAFLYPDGADEA